MDKKILKYKAKKNKLENKILNLLNSKKKNYENEIIDLNDNQLIINLIENYLNELNKTETKKLLVIVSGIYSVGKTTFINHFENFINKISEFISDSKISIKKILFDDINSNIEIDGNVTIVEINHNFNDFNTLNTKLNEIYEFNKNNLLSIKINILPKNKDSLKKKYINKIIQDVNTNSFNFIPNLNLMNDLNDLNDSIQKNINSLKLKKEIYSDNDFIFLDEILNYIFDLKINNHINDKYKIHNFINYYL